MSPSRKRWSKKLVRKPNQGLSTLLPGPAGWTCFITPGALDFTHEYLDEHTGS